MTILDDLLRSLPEDAPVRTVTVGAHWTLVCSRHCGLAATLLADKPHGHARVRDVGRLHHKSAHELAEYARSEDSLEASIGVAAINSLLAAEPQGAIDLNAAEVLVERGRSRKVALVGHFPFISALRRAAEELWVLEQRPSEGEFAAERAGELLPQADVLVITGTALINHSLDHLMGLARTDALVMVLGPSTPLSPVLFDHGAALLSGAVVVDEVAALCTLTQGAVLPQVEGLRLLTVARDPAGLCVSPPDKHPGVERRRGFPLGSAPTRSGERVSRRAGRPHPLPLGLHLRPSMMSGASSSCHSCRLGQAALWRAPITAANELAS